MRIACVYIPSFPLQAALVGHRDLTDVAGIAVVAQPVVGSPIVVACSRAAWTNGVRPGMSATAARTVDPGVTCVIAEVAAERAMLKAVGDAVLGIAPRIELGGDPRGQHHVMYVEVPAGKRGTWFGGKLRDLLAIFGLRGRIGIADDRFTAYVAAAKARDGAEVVDAGEDAVVCVPRGGSAAFLAPQALSLLPLGPEVLHMLEALGVKTLGAFADLPPPSVVRPERGDAWDSDFQALARGDGGSAIEGYQPSGAISERVTLAEGGLSIGMAIEALARRLAARMLGRGAVPADVMMRLERAGGLPAIRSLHVTEEHCDDLADGLANVLGRALGSEPWSRIEVVARPLAVSAATAVPVQAPAASPVNLAAEATRHEVEPIAPLVLLPSPAAYGDGRGERFEHRRTRRGKQRPRIGAGQARLFVGE
jgi:hypothetical protein